PSEPQLEVFAGVDLQLFPGHAPHNPFTDPVQNACANCGAPVARIPDVGNPWLDAGVGACPTQAHRGDRTYFDQSFPAQCLTEAFSVTYATLDGWTPRGAGFQPAGADGGAANTDRASVRAGEVAPPEPTRGAGFQPAGPGASVDAPQYTELDRWALSELHHLT